MKGKKAKTGTKSRKKASVLSKQRLRRKKRRLPGLRRWGLRALFAGLLLSIAWSVKEYSGDAFKNLFFEEVNWQINLKVDRSDPLDPEMAERVLKIAKEEIGQGSRNDLLNTAAQIQKEGEFETASIIKVSQNQIVLTIRRRVPILCVKAGALRLLTQEGSVYGRVKSQAECPGPILTGVIDQKRPVQLRPDHTIRLNPTEKDFIEEAVDLALLAKEAKLQLSTLTFSEFRGFVAKISANSTTSPHSIVTKDSEGSKDLGNSGDSYEVHFGRAPFEIRVKRLVEINQQLKEKGHIATRIELDYHGKAFIKSKTKL